MAIDIVLYRLRTRYPSALYRS